MCDSAAANATAAEEGVGCRFCTTYTVCRAEGCTWKSVSSITREDLLSGRQLGSCLDARDPYAILVSVLLMTIGGCLMLWCIGWCVKDSGKMAALRRHGVTTTAAVIARHANDAQILTMEGYPMMVTKFHADVQFTAAPDGGVSCRFPQLQQWFCGKVLLLEALAAAGCWLLRNPRPLCAAVRSWRPARPDTLAAAGARRHGAGKCSPGWWRRP